MTVAKLKGARDRVRRQRGKCEGRKSYSSAKVERSWWRWRGNCTLIRTGARRLYAPLRPLWRLKGRHANRAAVFGLCRCLDAHRMKSMRAGSQRRGADGGTLRL